jgi:mRNA interferase MazF
LSTAWRVSTRNTSIVLDDVSKPVVVTAARVLRASPSVVKVVPLTRTLRGYESEVLVEPDEANGLDARSAAQCQHVRAVATKRIRDRVGNVGPVVLGQIRDTLGVLLDV